MKIFHAAAELDASTDEKRDINFDWPYIRATFIVYTFSN